MVYAVARSQRCRILATSAFGGVRSRPREEMEGQCVRRCLQGDRLGGLRGRSYATFRGEKCGGCSRHGSTGRRGASLCLRPVRPELHQISEVPHYPLLVSSRLWESHDLPCAQSWFCHPSFAGRNYREFSILGPRTSSGQDDSQPLIIDSATDRVLFSFAGFLLYFARILRDGFVHHARPGRCAQTVPRL